MNLETALEPRVWNAVRASLEARKYTAAILDAVHLLTDVIRDRAGLEGDGVALVGAAFGGTSPKLKVNRLQTESEQNVQRGMEAMLRGLYQAVRNPRSHDAYQDNERDAQALLLYIDYLLRLVDQSGSPFSVQAIVARILDPDFVPSERYAKLLVNEIPQKKRLGVCREVFARRKEADREKVQYFFREVLAQMSPDEATEFHAIVSQELRETSDEDTIRFVLGTLPASIWPQLDEAARLRIENKLIASVKAGRWIRRMRRCPAGALGTWISHILRVLSLKDEFWDAVVWKLNFGDLDEQDYVFNYFLREAINCFDIPPASLVRCVNAGLSEGDKRFHGVASFWALNDDFEEKAIEDPWRQPFVEALRDYTEAPATSEKENDSRGDPIPF